MTNYQGKTIFDGYAIGEIKVLAESHKTTNAFTSFDNEWKRFEQARQAELAKLDALYQDTLQKLGEEKARLFETHKLMVTDLDFEDLIKAAIKENKTAEQAVDVAAKQLANNLSQLDDEYMKARSADVLEVGKAIVGILTGHSKDFELTKPTIVVCDDLASGDLMQFDKSLLKGLVLIKGNQTAHVSILARSIQLPTICNVEDFKLEQSLNGKQAILDASAGKFIVDASQDEVATYEQKAKAYEQEKQQLKQLIGKPSTTKDGFTTKICCNIASANETESVLANDGEGVGLFRTEFIYLKATDYPTEEYQFNIYKQALEGMKGKEVIIRTLDIGADKTVDYFKLPKEENPALGYRSIRICLDRPDVFKTQLRALYRASAYGKLAIMIPMIIDVKEIEFAKKCIEEVKQDLTAKNIPFAKDIKLGIMIETPAAAVMSDILAQHVDFFSIGTNDLIQYTLACDRINSNLSHIYDPYNKGVLRLIKMTIENAHKHNIVVSMCGEMARDPKVLPFLMGLHIDKLSLSASYVLKTRKAISEIDASKVDVDSFIK